MSQAVASALSHVRGSPMGPRPEWLAPGPQAVQGQGATRVLRCGRGRVTAAGMAEGGSC